MGRNMKRGTKSFDLALALTACAVYVAIAVYHFLTFGG